MSEASRLVPDGNLLFGRLVVVFGCRVGPDIPLRRGSRPQVPVGEVSQAAITVEESVETRAIVVRRRSVSEAAKVGAALDVGLRVEPVGRVHVELLDLLLAATG